MSTGGFTLPGPKLPPIANAPFVTAVNGDLTIMALNFLQQLWGMAYAAYNNTQAGTNPDESTSAASIVANISDYAPSKWTPALAGSVTPGSTAYSTQDGWQFGLGPLVVASFSVVTTGPLSGASGSLILTGPPAKGSPIHASQAGWLASYGGLTLDNGFWQAGIGMGATAATIYESGSAYPTQALPASAVKAPASLAGMLIYAR